MESIKTAIDLAMDALHEGVIITDDRMYVKQINKRALELLQTTEAAIKKKPLFLFFKEFAQGATCLSAMTALSDSIFGYAGQELIAQYNPLLTSEGKRQMVILINDLNSHQSLKAKSVEDAFYYDALDAIMNHINEWIVIVDQNGIITTMSQSYKAFLNEPNPEGKHVTEVIENTQMHKVIESGVAELGEVQMVKGNLMIASRMPILQNGKVVGAMGKAIFKDMDDFYTLFNKVTKMQKKATTFTEFMAAGTNTRYSFSDISGNSLKTKQAVDLAKKASRTDSNVLLVGPSGTGKEIFAHAIHQASARRAGPFIMINCAAIPSELLESELFGYDQGAFTGANQKGRKGRFEMAHHGTIFLDEIGDMPLDMQAKLLRVLQSKEVDRVGGDAPIPIDVRVIAATNRDVETLVEQERFRKDLYYRLNVMRINLAPLKDRKEEIPDIASDILLKLTNRMGLIVHGFTEGALKALSAYDWPGNIRELENVLERALNLLEDDLYIKEALLPESVVGVLTQPAAKGHAGPLQQETAALEMEWIQRAIKEAGGNKKKAAERLGISRAGLYKKLNHYSLHSKPVKFT